MSHLESALGALDKHYSSLPNPPADLKFQHAKMRATIRAYDQVWGNYTLDLEILGVEKTLTAPLKNLETGKESSYLLAGKLDVICREFTGRKRLLLLDHKFLYRQFDQNDIEHLLISGQPNHYSYLGLAHGIRFDAILWDVIAKSSHKPREESSRLVQTALPEKVYKNGNTRSAREEVREVTPAETPTEFEERIYHIMMDSSKTYFARPVVPVLKHNVAEYIHELYLWVKELDMDSKGKDHLKNDENCLQFGSPCEFMGVCTGKSDIDDPEVWNRRESIHPELELGGVNPLKIITQSRMKMYRACRLKHHRKYNLGLTKRREDDRIALIAGTAGHAGLEAYFKSIAISQGRNLD